MELKVIETMKIFNGKANARQYRINIRELMVTGSCKAPEETRKVEKNVLVRLLSMMSIRNCYYG